MDGSLLSQFPHLSWFEQRFSAPPSGGPMEHHFCHTTDTVYLTRSGHETVRWIRRGHETAWRADHRTVRFLQADEEHHTVLPTVSTDYRGCVFLIPRRHLGEVREREGHAGAVRKHSLLVHDDHVLCSCIERLTFKPAHDDRNACLRKDEAARRLVLRLVELRGGGIPDWHDDESLFTGSALAHLVDRIDANLRVAPSLSDMASIVGLSPSHFAKKFRHSTGLSLHRFINRRRIRASFESLERGDEPLARVALELGFSSQSHFTRLFSALTGHTPARHRRDFRRSVGWRESRSPRE